VCTCVMLQTCLHAYIYIYASTDACLPIVRPQSTAGALELTAFKEGGPWNRTTLGGGKREVPLTNITILGTGTFEQSIQFITNTTLAAGGLPQRFQKANVSKGIPPLQTTDDETGEERVPPDAAAVMPKFGCIISKAGAIIDTATGLTLTGPEEALDDDEAQADFEAELLPGVLRGTLTEVCERARKAK